jgi:hypothetical protein
MEKEKFSLKDQLFNEGKIIKIANDIARVYPAFKKDKFIKNVVQSFPEIIFLNRMPRHLKLF